MTPHETHDTISVLAQDKNGDLAGACTTSGWAYKLHGRVGDSSIIGSGLFVDNEIGCAAAINNNYIVHDLFFFNFVPMSNMKIPG
jgi:isoaspartyl peptidase/L-asparaginase-like protein (Ntn-hydrolase superfamily)